MSDAMKNHGFIGSIFKERDDAEGNEDTSWLGFDEVQAFSAYVVVAGGDLLEQVIDVQALRENGIGKEPEGPAL